MTGRSYLVGLNDMYPDLFLALDANSQEQLRKLANHEDWLIRAIVAQNESCPADVLALLAQDEDHFVKNCVASNKKIAPELLNKMALGAKESPPYLVSICKNPRASADTLIALLTLPYLHASIARHKNLPTEMLEKLADESSVAVAQNPHCPAYLLDRILAKNEDNYYINYILAANPASAPELLRKIYHKNKNRETLAALAANKNTPQEILNVLSKNFYFEIRRNVLQNAATGDDILQYVAYNDISPILVKMAQDKLQQIA